MFAFFDRLMAWTRRHYTLTWLLCIAALTGIGLLDELGWELWAMELLTLPLNLLSWPLLLVYLQDWKAYRKQARSYSGFPRHLSLMWFCCCFPAAVTTVAALHLLASF